MTMTVDALYERLLATWRPQHWWPGETALEIVIGAILTQNTAWHNVEKAICRLRQAQLLDAERLLTAPEEQVKEAIRPAGFYNVKYPRLCSTVRLLFGDEQDTERWYTSPVQDLHGELLAINGIGPETADSVLLYAFGHPVFVVDAYTRRLLGRLGYATQAKVSYDQIAQLFTAHLPRAAALYNEYHALIVAQCKTVCRPKPFCKRCALATDCPACKL